MSSDWQNKRTKDAYLASIPYGLRQQMEADARQGKGVPAAYEATVTGSFLTMPRPMYQGSVQGTEEGGFEVQTSPGGRDSHTHTAYIDGFGNGHTSTDGENPHSHSVVSFQVAPHQGPYGMMDHEHIGELSIPGASTHDPTPPYTGEL